MEPRNGGLGRAAAIGKAAVGAGERIKLPGLQADRANRMDCRLGASKRAQSREALLQKVATSESRAPRRQPMLRQRFSCRSSQA